MYTRNARGRQHVLPTAPELFNTNYETTSSPRSIIPIRRRADMDASSSPGRPKSSSSARPGPRPLPIPNAFGGHPTNTGTPAAMSVTHTASRGSTSAVSSPEHDADTLPTIRNQNDIIKDLKGQIRRCQAQKQLTTMRIQKLERENQQLHQDVLWKESTLERLKGRLDVGNQFAERNGMVEIISKTLAAELLLAKQHARDLEGKMYGVAWK